MNNRPLVSPQDARSYRGSAMPRAGWSRWLAMAGALVAMTMLAAFYSIVTGGVQRAAAKNEQMRAEAARALSCGASPTWTTREACLASAPVPVNALTSVSYRSPSAASSKTASSMRFP